MDARTEMMPCLMRFRFEAVRSRRERLVGPGFRLQTSDFLSPVFHLLVTLFRSRQGFDVGARRHPLGRRKKVKTARDPENHLDCVMDR